MAGPSIETKLYQAIKARVNMLPMKATYPIVWTTGEAYEPNPAQPYLRATWLPNMNRRALIGSGDPHQRLGILQLDVMEKRSRRDTDAIEIAGQVAAHFLPDQRLSFEGIETRVTKAPDVGAVFIDKFIQVPVTIEFEAWA